MRVVIDGIEFAPKTQAIQETDALVEALKTTLDVLEYLEVRTSSGVSLNNIRMAIKKGHEVLAPLKFKRGSIPPVSKDTSNPNPEGV